MRPANPLYSRKRLKLLRPCIAALAISTVFTFYPSRAVQAPSPWTTDSVLALMDKSAQQFRSLTASITHTKFSAVVSDTSTEKGDLYVRRDDKMRIDMLTPDKRTIL